MKNVTFTVAVNFKDSINSNEEIKKVIENALEGLIEQVNHAGLAPETSETYTTKIEISKDGKVVVKHIF